MRIRNSRAALHRNIYIYLYATPVIDDGITQVPRHTWHWYTWLFRRFRYWESGILRGRESNRKERDVVAVTLTVNLSFWTLAQARLACVIRIRTFILFNPLRYSFSFNVSSYSHYLVSSRPLIPENFLLSRFVRYLTQWRAFDLVVFSRDRHEPSMR